MSALSDLLSSPASSWDDALCRGKSDQFFSTKHETVFESERLCQTCPRLDECRIVAKGEKNGVWAGQFRHYDTHTLKRYQAYRNGRVDQEAQLLNMAEKLGIDVDEFKRAAGL